MMHDIDYLLNSNRQPVHLAKGCFDTVCFQLCLCYVELVIILGFFFCIVCQSRRSINVDPDSILLVVQLIYLVVKVRSMILLIGDACFILNMFQNFTSDHFRQVVMTSLLGR